MSNQPTHEQDQESVKGGEGIVAPSVVIPKDSSESAALPLCPVHQSLEDRGKLAVPIGGLNCVACTLNEREELLEILAPCVEIVRSIVNIYPDSVSILREVVEFYKTHAGKNRIVTSYPAAQPSVSQEAADGMELAAQLCEKRVAERGEWLLPSEKFVLTEMAGQIRYAAKHGAYQPQQKAEGESDQRKAILPTSEQLTGE